MILGKGYFLESNFENYKVAIINYMFSNKRNQTSILGIIWIYTLKGYSSRDEQVDKRRGVALAKNVFKEYWKGISRPLVFPQSPVFITFFFSKPLACTWRNNEVVSSVMTIFSTCQTQSWSQITEILTQRSAHAQCQDESCF